MESHAKVGRDPHSLTARLAIAGTRTEFKIPATTVLK